MKNLLKNKKALFNTLSAEALQFVLFIIFLVIGSVLVVNFGNAVGGQANVTANALVVFFGTTNGGFGSWSSSIITLIIAVIFIGALMGLMGMGRTKKY